MSQAITPKRVPKVKTKYRSIQTAIPAPQSIPILEQLRQVEPQSMQGQPPIVWDRADGFQVHDAWGNTWIDWSSGVLVANAGHGRPEIVRAITEEAKKTLLHNYCFPSEIRARLVQKLSSIAPRPLEKVFLLTTGAETTECAIKLAANPRPRRRGRQEDRRRQLRRRLPRPHPRRPADRRHPRAQRMDRQPRS